MGILKLCHVFRTVSYLPPKLDASATAIISTRILEVA